MHDWLPYDAVLTPYPRGGHACMPMAGNIDQHTRIMMYQHTDCLAALLSYQVSCSRRRISARVLLALGQPAQRPHQNVQAGRPSVGHRDDGAWELVSK
jgi:hypothetical protein